MYVQSHSLYTACSSKTLGTNHVSINRDLVKDTVVYTCNGKQCILETNEETPSTDNWKLTKHINVKSKKQNILLSANFHIRLWEEKVYTFNY